jgi:WD40 repeat protein
MPDLFISYARGDSRNFVARLSAALEERGKNTWVDLDDIPPASSWNDDLRTGISESDSFGFVISPASVSSPHCRSELEQAVALGKRILPVLHLPVADDQVPEAVATRNWIPQLGRFTDDFDTSLATLVTAIETDLDWVREHTRWGLRAQEWERRGEDRSVLARGSDLDQAEAFLSGGGGKEPTPTELQGRYVLASRRAATRRQRQLVTGVSIALVVAIVLGVLALLQRNTAVDQRHRAEKERANASSRALAASAFLNLPSDPQLSLLLALQAVRAARTKEGEEALRSAVLQSRVRHELDPDAGQVTVATYRPDGAVIGTASTDNTAALWDASTGKEIATLEGHDMPVQALRFSADSSRVVTVAADFTARVYDASSGAAISVIKDPEDYRLSDVAISADGSLVITSGFVHNHVKLWDATTGELRGRLPITTVDRIALSPDGSLLLTAEQNAEVDLWRVEDLSRAGSFPEDATGTFGAAAFSPDGSLFMTARTSQDHHGIAVVRRIDGTEVATVHHAEAITDAQFAPDSSSLVTSGNDGTAIVTDLRDGTETSRFAGHTGAVDSVAFAPDGSVVASGGDDGAVDLWRPSSGALVASLRGHRGPVVDVDFSPTDGRVVSASLDGTARIWSSAAAGGSFEGGSTTPVGQPLEGLDRAFSDDGRWALDQVWSGTDMTVQTIDTDTGETTAGFVLGKKEELLPAISEDGELVVTATDFDHTHPRVRRVSDGSVVASLDAPAAVSADFSPDGTKLALGGHDGTAGVFDVSSGEELVAFDGGGNPQDVASARFDRQGDRVATSSYGGPAQVWDASTGTLIRSLDAFGTVFGMAITNTQAIFSPVGSLLLTSAPYEADATLWDLTTGERVSTLEGLGPDIEDTAFSPSGRFILTGDFAGNVRLWDGRSGRLLSLVTTTGGFITNVAFSADEQDVFVLTSDTGDPPSGADALEVRTCDVCGNLDSLVSLARTRVVRDLTATEKATYLSDD